MYNTVMQFSPEILAILFISSIDFLLGIVIFLQNPRNPINSAYGFFAATVTAWGLGVGFFLATTNDGWGDFLARFLYFAGGSIPASFLYFSRILSAQQRFVSWQTFFIFFPTFCFFVLYFFTDLVIAGYTVTLAGAKAFTYGPFHLLFDAHLWVYFIFAFIALQKHYRMHEDAERYRTLFIILGTYLVLFVAGITNVIIPLLSIFSFIWIGPTATIVWVGIIAYAVLKHQLFNIRIIAAELFVISLWLLSLVRTFFSESVRDVWINMVTLMATVILGVFLARAVIKEVKTRREIERLAEDLRKANARLKELDQRKSEFVSLASHQLRNPLTAIKGYASMILDGSFGVVSHKIKDAVEKIFESSERLVMIIEDFLTVSRIEQGRLDYNFTHINFKSLVETIIADMRSTIEKKGLTLSFEYEKEKEYYLIADSGKVVQIIGNLIENALKYTPRGLISIHLSKNTSARTVTFSIKDTGIGMSHETKKKIFSKFTRAHNAHEVNVGGTGLGLFIARQLVEAHKGRIWAESDGEGKGSTFYFELPAEE